jgi:hypothetical protein
MKRPVEGGVVAKLWRPVVRNHVCGDAVCSDSCRRQWAGKADEQKAVYANRRRVKGDYGKALLVKGLLKILLDSREGG